MGNKVIFCMLTLSICILTIGTSLIICGLVLPSWQVARIARLRRENVYGLYQQCAYMERRGGDISKMCVLVDHSQIKPAAETTGEAEIEQSSYITRSGAPIQPAGRYFELVVLVLLSIASLVSVFAVVIGFCAICLGDLTFSWPLLSVLGGILSTVAVALYAKGAADSQMASSERELDAERKLGIAFFLACGGAGALLVAGLVSILTTCFGHGNRNQRHSNKKTVGPLRQFVRKLSGNGTVDRSNDH